MGTPFDPGPFTVMRVEGGRIWLHTLHADRIFWAYRYLRSQGISVALPSRRVLIRRLQTCLPHPLPPHPLRVRVQFDLRGHVVEVQTRPIPPLSPTLPTPLRWHTWYPVVHPGPYLPWKVGRWTPFLRAWEQARSRGKDEALILKRDGEVVSLARANLLLYRDGRWWTPAAASGCTYGVMRRLLYRILRPQFLRFTRLTIRDLDRAEAVVGVNAVWGILPLAAGRQQEDEVRALWERVRPVLPTGAGGGE